MLEIRKRAAAIPRRRVPPLTMTLLDRLLVTEIGSSFGVALGLFTVLLVMNHLFYLARLIIGEGIAIQVALVLMAYKIPYFVCCRRSSLTIRRLPKAS